MKLYLVHCGFYDATVTAGLYEGHTNILVAAEDLAGARIAVRQLPEFKRLKMHIDGMQEITAVQGYDVVLKANPKLEGKTILAHQGFGGRTTRKVEI